MSTPAQATITIPASQPMVALLGPGDELLRVVEAQFPDADIHVRGNEMRLSGSADDVGLIEILVAEMLAVLRTGQGLTTESVERSIALLRAGTRPAEVLSTNILSSRGRTIRAKSLNQKRYVEAIDHHTVTFGIGPAGTGKTYLAVAKAVQALQAKKVTRIILTRPAVEAGERLGFLPGTLSEKIDPYLRPLYDALDDLMPFERIQKAIDSRTIEVAPLAFMRGRTLGDAFVILDEAQNATHMQMKMFLTRLGVNSKIVITGDKTQIDLPKREESGLMQIERILHGIEGIAFHYFTDADVVRHRLVRDIIRA
ncbi:MAG: PhoH family protein, partial [Candidatus Nanopelagicales bacterium]